ncbi:MAG TPA: hypothetical protein VGB45_10465 [Abditibacterium sp.]|jgi:hypothetical protein
MTHKLSREFLVGLLFLVNLTVYSLWLYLATGYSGIAFSGGCSEGNCHLSLPYAPKYLPYSPAVNVTVSPTVYQVVCAWQCVLGLHFLAVIALEFQPSSATKQISKKPKKSVK